MAYAFSSDSLARAIAALIPDEPKMVNVARCESGLRQYDASGNVLRGGLGGSMIGLFQFNEVYHRSAALSLGYDLDTILGNIAYARELYHSQGLTPWMSSAHCWQSKTVVRADVGAQVSQTATSAAMQTQTAVRKTLRYGMRDTDVATLIRALRSAGYPASSSVATNTYFGVDVFKALIAFQCDHGIACLSGSVSQGIGVADPRTWEALLNAASTAQ